MGSNRTSLLVLLAAFCATGTPAEVLDKETLALGTDPVGAWYETELREDIEAAADPTTDMDALLEEARERIDAALAEDGSDCRGSMGESKRRACAFRTNLSRYEAFLLADQTCRTQTALDVVSDPSESADTVMASVSDATAAISASAFADRDLFTPVRVGQSFPMFEETIVPADCAGTSDLHMTTIIIPAASTADTDKLVLAYALALSFRTWEYNRPNVEVTTELIRRANERWSKFETNVIHDQYPWETLLFNDWLAGASSRFSGTLTHPPTQQIRAIHPVPTGILDISGGDTLFRPRITVELIGLRYLDEIDYVPKRAISLITTLKAEAGESNGWGLLYTWKRGSLGVIHQEVSQNDDVISLVFGIDLANQIESKRNGMMEKWETLRAELHSMSDRSP